jgi:hypothetical protein
MSLIQCKLSFLNASTPHFGSLGHHGIKNLGREHKTMTFTYFVHIQMQGGNIKKYIKYIKNPT